MKKIFASMVILILFSAYGLGQNQMDGKKNGKTLFTDNKCVTCHTIDAEGITLKTKKKNVPDLSGVGLTYNAGFIEKYLKKEETIDNKKHAPMFKGSNEELEVLSAWLASLKTDIDPTDNDKKGIKEDKPNSDVDKK